MTYASPFEILPTAKTQPAALNGQRSALFCFCDHASNHIPDAYDNLGLSRAELDRHIGWDIGSAKITRGLCDHFGGGGILAGFSRLLVDANRDPNCERQRASLMPPVSDGTAIPRNQNISPQDRQARLDHFFTPYHQALSAQLDQLLARTHDPLIVSVHSFTPHPKIGAVRDIEIGLLWKVDLEISERLKAEIEAVHPYTVALNAPYSGLRLNHTIDYHIIPRGLRHVTLEIRQDLIDTDDKCAVMTTRLIPALSAIL